MSTMVKAHLPCSDCGSSDGLAEYVDHTFCFVCETTHFFNNNMQKGVNNMSAVINNDDMQIAAIKARGITADTCRKFGYYIAKDNYGKPIQVANYVNDGKVVFQKTRDKDKNFYVLGKKQYVFFGQHLFPSGNKLVITEGEIDCLTVSQINGNKYPVVSIPFGCKSAERTFKENLDWLNGFKEIIIMFDMDEPGKKAVESVVGLLPPHKLKIATLPHKDANECLLHGDADAVIRSIYDAVEYRPDGIINAKDLKDVLMTNDEDIVSYEYPWSDELNKMTMGIRKYEMLLLTAGTGIGKSTTAREIAYKLKMQDKLKIGLVMLEESPKKTIRDIMSIHLKKPLHLLWKNESVRQEVADHYDEVFGDGSFCLYDHFGSIESPNLLDKIRYLIVAECCDFVIFDHISIAVSGLDDGSNERKCIDVLMTQLRSLVEETGAGLIVISHLRKPDSKSVSFEQGGCISLDDLRGSGTLKQLPDIILALERNQQADVPDEKNTMKIRVLKNRFCGTTGLAGSIKFNKSKHRIETIDALDVEGDSDDEQQF